MYYLTINGEKRADILPADTVLPSKIINNSVNYENCVDSMAIAIATGEVSLDELLQMRISPYFPYTYNSCRISENTFCSDGIGDVRDLFREVNDSIEGSGIKSVDIVGSAAFGLSNNFPYGCKQERQNYGYLLEQTEPKTSDIDVQLIVDERKIWEVSELLHNTFDRFNRSGSRRSATNVFGVSIFSFQAIEESLENDPASTALVNYLVWEPHRLRVIDNEEMYEHFRKIGKKAIRRTKALKFFYANLAHRFLFNASKLKIKVGFDNIEQIFLPYDDVWTAFSPEIWRNKSKLRLGFFNF